ncbi:MAG: pitrilysin family protein [Bacteroidetes bacterium]|jgi:zinc protease|nr:pitrilysin family protein [Bacteroidota bacterium]
MAVDRIAAPIIKDAIDFNIQLKPYHKFTLDNGVEVYAYEGGAQEVVLVDLVFYAGNSFEQKNWVAAATNFLLKNGTSTKTSFEITDAFEFYGAHLNRSCTNETATVTLHCLSKHYQEVIPLMGEIIAEATFPEKEIAILKQNQIQRLLLNLKKGDFIANRLIDEYLFGFDHPYGKYSVEQDYKNINREDLVTFYEQYYKQGKCVIFIAGKFPATMEPLLNKYIGQLPLNKKEIKEQVHPIVSATQKKYSIVNDTASVQGSIRLARHFPNRHHPDFPAAQVLNNIFGGFFGSRLMSNIREDKGYTYGIHSYLQNYMHAGAWMVSTDAGKDVCKATIEEVYKEMKILRETLVKEEELKLVKNYMLGALLGDLDGPFQIISRWKTYLLNDLTEDYFYNTIKVVRSVTSEELQVLAEKYLKEEDFFELVVY